MTGGPCRDVERALASVAELAYRNQQLEEEARAKQAELLALQVGAQQRACRVGGCA